MSAGEDVEMVDSGNITLTNTTDSLTFGKLRNAKLHITSDVIKRQKMNNTLDKHFELRDLYITAQLYVTEPEIATWIGWTAQTLNLPDAHSFGLAQTGDNGTTSTISGTYRLKDLTFSHDEEGYAVYDIRLESVDGSPAES